VSCSLTCSFIFLLESSENHLGAWDVLLGRLQIYPQRVLAPGDALVLVSVCVREVDCLARLATKQTVQVGARLVLASL